MGKDLYLTIVAGVPCDPSTPDGEGCKTFPTDTRTGPEAVFGVSFGPSYHEPPHYGVRDVCEIYFGGYRGGGVKNISSLIFDPGCRSFVEQEAVARGVWQPHLYGVYLVVRINE